MATSNWDGGAPYDTVTSWGWQGTVSMGPTVTLWNISILEQAYRNLDMYFGVPKFGDGVITAVTGKADDAKLVIAFASAGSVIATRP